MIKIAKKGLVNRVVAMALVFLMVFSLIPVRPSIMLAEEMKASFTFVLKDDEGVALSNKDVTIYDEISTEVYSGATNEEGIIVQNVLEWLLDK